MPVLKKYDESGQSTELDNENVIFAKETKSGRNNVVYSIRVEDGFFSDPISMYVERSSGIDLNRKLKSDYKYRQVSKNVFDLYLHYLKTRKKVFLRQAEREYRCG